jgi:hypothetical protein
MLTLAFYYLASLSLIFFQESIGSDFSDLGKQLLAGFAVAVAVAVTFTIIKLRRRDKNPPVPFISIIASETGDTPSNSGIDPE